MQRTILGITALLTILLTCHSMVSYAGVPAFNPFQQDTVPSKRTDLRFPLTDRRGDAFNYPNRNTFDLQRPSNFTDSIAYDPATKRYYIYEKIGRSWYRKPTYLTFDEMLAYKTRQDEREYFQRRLNTTLNASRLVSSWAPLPSRCGLRMARTFQDSPTLAKCLIITSTVCA